MAYGASERQAIIAEYSEYRKQVDRHIIAIAGVGLNDLADTNAVWEGFDGGQSAKSCAREVLAEEGFPFE